MQIMSLIASVLKYWWIVKLKTVTILYFSDTRGIINLLLTHPGRNAHHKLIESLFYTEHEAYYYYSNSKIKGKKKLEK